MSEASNPPMIDASLRLRLRGGPSEVFIGDQRELGDHPVVDVRVEELARLETETSDMAHPLPKHRGRGYRGAVQDQRAVTLHAGTC